MWKYLHIIKKVRQKFQLLLYIYAVITWLQNFFVLNKQLVNQEEKSN